MKQNDAYVDLDGDAIALCDLDAAERKLLARLRRRARTHPDWTDFDNYWTNAVPAFYVARGLARKAVPETTLWQIAQDLSSRLGIAGGYIRPPGPLDDLEDMVLFKFGSVGAFCKATGIPENVLDQFLKDRADMSLQTLAQGLERIGYRLRIVPAAPARPAAKSTRAKRGKRQARSA